MPPGITLFDCTGKYSIVSAVQCSAVQFSAVQCSAVQCSAGRSSVVSVVQCPAG
jgi:hypothetical protein